jgi:hypothetical protein
MSILLRIVNVVRTWMDVHPHHFRNNETVVEALRTFISSDVAVFSPEAAKILENSLNKMLSSPFTCLCCPTHCHTIG